MPPAAPAAVPVPSQTATASVTAPPLQQPSPAQGPGWNPQQPLPAQPLGQQLDYDPWSGQTIPQQMPPPDFNPWQNWQHLPDNQSLALSPHCKRHGQNLHWLTPGGRTFLCLNLLHSVRLLVHQCCQETRHNPSIRRSSRMPNPDQSDLIPALATVGQFGNSPLLELLDISQNTAAGRTSMTSHPHGMVPSLRHS